MIDTQQLKAIATRLASNPVQEVVSVGSGGNSRVYMVATADRLFVLKEYPEGDTRNRLETERHALELMHWHGIETIPTWIAAEDNFALMTWVDGASIKTPKPSDIDEAAVFLGTLHHISHKTPAADMPLASEACLSGQMIINQLEARVANLMPHTKDNPALMKFLSGSFMPTFTKRFKAAKEYPTFATELPQEQRTLIAADFGFHNIMRGIDGRLYFLDFEYFGWDDPVKLMCDFLLHPATPLADEMKKTFYSHMLVMYGDDIKARFTAYYPLFGLRWALILLNGFIPECWAAKPCSTTANWQEAKSAQLVKAEAMIRVSDTLRCQTPSS